MGRERPRWRVRISTLMMLVVIAALSLALFVEHQRRIAAERRWEAEARRARLEAMEAQAVAEQATARLRWALEKAKDSRPKGE